MKKWFCILLAVLAITKFSNAQTLNVKGTVKDVNNKPVSLVSVVIEKQKSSIATDNNGSFKLSVPKYSKLTFSSIGYKDTVVIIKDELPLNITLLNTVKDLGNVTVTDYQQRAQTNNDLKREIVSADFAHYSFENGISTGGIIGYNGKASFAKNGGMNWGAAIPEFHTREDARGSIYLFSEWQKGLVAKSDDSTLVDDPNSHYNINKKTGDLIMTNDFNSGLTIDKAQIKFFTLFDTLKNTHSFMIVPVISSTAFCEIIVLGNNYDVFKLTTTKFVKADFTQMVLPHQEIITMNMLMQTNIICLM